MARGNVDYDQMRDSARKGNGTKFQMFGAGASIPGSVPMFDDDGNLIDSGKQASTISPGGTGGGVSHLSEYVVQSRIVLGNSIQSVIPVAAGDLIIVAYGFYGGADPTCLDSLGTSYAKVVQRESGSGNQIAIFHGLSGSFGLATITCASAGATYTQTAFIQVHGGWSNVDAYNSAAGKFVTVETTKDADFVFVAIGGYNVSSTFSPMLPVIAAGQIGGDDAMAIGCYISGTARTYLAGFDTLDAHPCIGAVAFQ